MYCVLIRVSKTKNWWIPCDGYLIAYSVYENARQRKRNEIAKGFTAVVVRR